MKSIKYYRFILAHHRNKCILELTIQGNAISETAYR